MAGDLTREEMDMLAAEYVVGLLDRAEFDHARGLAETNGTMRLFVEVWEDRLAPLAAGYAPVPAPDVWPLLDRRLFAVRRRARVFWLVVAGLSVLLAVKVGFWFSVLM